MGGRTFEDLLESREDGRDSRCCDSVEISTDS